jgi:hypothetical protein
MSALVDTNTTPRRWTSASEGFVSRSYFCSWRVLAPPLALNLSLDVREESTSVHLTFHDFIEVTGPGLRSGDGIGLANAYTMYRYVGLAKTFAL